MGMEAVRGGVRSLVARAERAAQKRGQRPSTAHWLLVMLQEDGDLGLLLRDQGVRETDLLNALRVVDPEAMNTMDRAIERSRQLAERLGHRGASPWHLLLAITRDSRSAGHRSLARMGMGPSRLHDEILSRFAAATEHQSAGRRRPSRSGTSRSASTRSEGSRPVLRAGRRPSLPQPIAPRRPVGPVRPASAKPRRASARRGRPRVTITQKSRHEIVVDPLTQQAVVAGAAPDGALKPTLDPEQFPVLTEIGTDLTAKARAGLIDPVIGRADEIEALLDILARRRSNNPILVGPPGVGKTAIVEGLAQHLIEGDGPLADRIVIELSAGSLVSGTGVRGALSKKITALREEVARAGRVLLFIDEIHGIVGPEGGGPDDLASELKAGLARGELPCIGATTEREYRRHIEKDPALARRFSPIQVDEPSREDAVSILQGIAPHYGAHHSLTIEDEALQAAVHLSSRYLVEGHLPDKAIGVLDLAGARVRRRGGTRVDRQAIAEVLAERTKIDVDRLLMRDGERLTKLESLLAQSVVGHQGAIARISDALRKSAAGFRGARPLGTFLFLGPTGVGKTEMAKAISETFFAGTPMTRFDMSELSEKHAVARLFGAPPGYVGHDEGGQLTEAIRRRPYQLILLDEIEKAHPEVLLSLLPLLDEGRITDGKGRTVDGQNTIIVLTSNLGAVASERRAIGFGDGGDSSRAARALAAVRGALPPELFNRIDEPLFFAPLGRDEVREIARRMLTGVVSAMAEQGVTLKIAENVPDALIEAGGYDPSLGARPMRRVLGREVELMLASGLLRGAFGAGDTILLEAAEGDEAVAFRTV